MKASTRHAAQARVDRIRQFQAELADLDREQVLLLSPEQQQRLDAHHRHLLSQLEREAGADISESARRISWGIRIVGLLGSAAFAAAAVLFLHRVWGLLPLPLQLCILAGTPVALLAATEVLYRRGMDPFFVGLVAVWTVLASWQATETCGVILNRVARPHSILAVGLIASLLGHAYRLRLVLCAGLLGLGIYGAAMVVEISGSDWQYWPLRGQYLLPAAALFYSVSWVPRRLATPLEPLLPAYAFSGGLLSLLGLLLMSTTGHLCCGDIDLQTFAAIDQLLGLAIASWLVGHGLRRGWNEVVYLGAAGFILFLFVRLHAWWWYWMPKYLFFLCLSLISVALLVVFRQLRQRWSRREAL
ncbi:MAG: hypothetical protein JNK85_24050 [Verrucomicrobiales bacterium]|nr:hypothetical protein [Verrucomicrobiales bacterium]